MPRVLVTATEIRDALGRLEMIDVAGEKCVDGEQLLAVVAELVPFAQPPMARKPDVSFRDDPTPAPETPAVVAAFDRAVREEEQTIAEAFNREVFQPAPTVREEADAANLELLTAGAAYALPLESSNTPAEYAAHLAHLPPGECFRCGHAAHAGDVCIETLECECAEYVDSVIREPWLAAEEAMTAGAPAPSWFGHGPPGTPGIDPQGGISAYGADSIGIDFGKTTGHRGDPIQ